MSICNVITLITSHAGQYSLQVTLHFSHIVCTLSVSAHSLGPQTFTCQFLHSKPGDEEPTRVCLLFPAEKQKNFLLFYQINVLIIFSVTRVILCLLSV